MGKRVSVGLDEVIAHFAELEDPRSEINRLHPLVSVVVIAIMAVLAGASGPTGIAEWARIKEDLLRNLLPLPHGVPRKDVFRRVLAALKPDVFQVCFVDWLQSLRDAAMAATGIDQPVLAIDGKTLRRSHDKKNGLGALHSVSIDRHPRSRVRRAVRGPRLGRRGEVRQAESSGKRLRAALAAITARATIRRRPCCISTLQATTCHPR